MATNIQIQIYINNGWCEGCCAMCSLFRVDRECYPFWDLIEILMNEIYLKVQKWILGWGRIGSRSGLVKVGIETTIILKWYLQRSNNFDRSGKYPINSEK